MATYRGGLVTRSDLTKHINKGKYKKLSNDEKLSTIWISYKIRFNQTY